MALNNGGFSLDGITAVDFSGSSVSGAGDVNGDGFADLIIGASAADPNAPASGESYLVFGGDDLSSLQLSDVANGTGGFVLNGIDFNDQSGFSVSSAGDVNGDGFDDLIVGTRDGDPNAVDAGESYVIFGDDFTGAVTVASSAGNDTLNGGGGVDVIVAGLGNDMVFGGGGADVLRGGGGSDLLLVADLGFAKIVGGSGDDALGLDNIAGVNLDLTAIADPVIQGIEGFVITGSGDNTLTLNAREVLNLSDTTNKVIVTGDAGDAVVTTDNGWTNTGADPEFANHTLFTNGTAQLSVDNLVDQSSIIIGAGGLVINGTAGDDSLVGTAGNDTISGLGGNDTVRGLTGADFIDGGTGLDILDGGTENDTLIGDNAQDEVAVFAVNSGDYTINGVGSGVVRVIDNNPGDGDDGSDLLFNLEVADFADVNVNIADALTPIAGTSGADSIDGNASANTINSFAGDDTIRGGGGNDFLLGETGTDTAVFDGVFANFTITGEGAGFVLVIDEVGGNGTDRLVDFEFAQFDDQTVAIVGGVGALVGEQGTAGDDVILGLGGLVDGLEGRAGNDFLDGGVSAGSDVFNGGLGNDTAIGGGSNGEVALFAGNFADYTVSGIGGGVVRVTDNNPSDGDDGTDVLINIEAADFADLLGFNIADPTIPFAGTPGADVIDGNASSNTLIGFGGNDTMDGGGANDLIEGDGGDDRLIGGAGSDTIGGGAGTDTAVFTGNSADYTIDAVGAGFVRVTDDNAGDGDDGTDILLTVEFAEFTDQTINVLGGAGAFNGTLGADVLLGTAGDDTILGLAGSDTISGFAGADFIDGGASPKNLDGGAGNDTLIGDGAQDEVAVFSGNSADYTINGIGSGVVRVIDNNPGDGDDGSDHLFNLEIADFADLNMNIADAFTPTAGTLGSDLIDGNPSANTVHGFAGDDTIRGGGSSDFLLGGTGTDTAVFDGVLANYTITGEGAGFVLVIDEVGGNGTDRLVDFEFAQFTDQTIAIVGGVGALVGEPGTAGNDTILGLGGADTLEGGDGNDFLDGRVSGSGDTFDGGLGNDTLVGNGAQSEVARFSGVQADYTISGVGGGVVQVIDNNVVDGDDGTDILIDIEAVDFSDVQGVNIADGTGPMVGTPGTDVIDGNAGGNTLIGFGGDDTIDGLGGNDPIEGDGGADLLSGGAGNDTIGGGAGIDTAVFAGNSGDFTIDAVGAGFVRVTDNNVGDGDEGENILLNVESVQFSDQTINIVGGAGGINGTSGGDVILGTVGNDTILGLAGSDTISGQAGADFLDGGTGTDTFDGGIGNDTLIGDGSQNEVAVFAGIAADYTISGVNTGVVTVIDNNAGDGDDGTDTLVNLEIARFTDGDVNIADGFLPLAGTLGDDSIVGNPSGNPIHGFAGDDTLDGQGGGDNLFGGAGEDRLLGGVGNDNLDGGDGLDTAVFGGNVGDYTINGLGGGDFEVIDNNAGDGDDGTDNLTGVESLDFSDLTVGTGVASSTGLTEPMTVPGTPRGTGIAESCRKISNRYSSQTSQARSPTTQVRQTYSI